MADDWISAHEALQLLAEAIGEAKATKTICTWAHEGAVPARAKLFGVGSDLKSDTPIPPEFWWPRGDTRMSQDWNLGNFEATTMHRGLLLAGSTFRAYGVEFERGALDEMIPPHLKPKAVRRGRRPKYDWTLASEAVLDLLERGILKPSQQADVEKALSDAFGASEEHPAESTIRRHASAIWEKYEEAHKG